MSPIHQPRTTLIHLYSTHHHSSTVSFPSWPMYLHLTSIYGTMCVPPASWLPITTIHVAILNISRDRIHYSSHESLKSWLGSRLKGYSCLDTSHDSCPSLGVSHGAGQLDGDLHRHSALNIQPMYLHLTSIYGTMCVPPIASWLPITTIHVKSRLNRVSMIFLTWLHRSQVRLGPGPSHLNISRSQVAHLNSIQVHSQPHPGLEICVSSPFKLQDSRLLFILVESRLNPGPYICISPTSRPTKLHLSSI